MLACSVAEDMIKNDTVDDSMDFLARCASTTLAGGLRASISGLDPEMATGPSCDFDGIALQAVVTGMGCQVLDVKQLLVGCGMCDRRWHNGFFRCL